MAHFHPLPLPPWAIALIVLGSVLAGAVLAWLLTRPAFYNLENKVVVITGGSSGIGKATAKEALKRGAHVALLARREALLREAAAELAPFSTHTGQRITTHVADVADEASTTAAIHAAAGAHGGRVDVLVNSAGVSLAKRFEDSSAAEWEHTLRVNVMGTRNAIAAALPFMPSKARSTPNAPARQGGRIVLVSSQAGQTGLYGYTAYSASKFALRGLFEALSQELHTRGIRVSLVFPPDTDTPMLAEESASKPRLTHMLSEATVMVQPEAVAVALVAGVQRWSPFVSVGFDGWMLSTLTSGMAPCGNLLTAAVQLATLALWRAIGLLYTQYFYAVIAKHDAPVGSGGGAAAGLGDKSPAGGSGASASPLAGGGTAGATLTGPSPSSSRKKRGASAGAAKR